MNFYDSAEVQLILEAIGVDRINMRSTSIRGCCPIHAGSDNSVGFAVWQDRQLMWRATCHTRGCVKGSSMEWLVAKVRHCSVTAATHWIAQLLVRPDLKVPTFEHQAVDLRVDELPPVCLCDDSAWKRFVSLYPCHEYWRSRGYSERIVREFGLTYQTLENRAVIPVITDDGFVGMMERTFDPSMPKYIWQSPNSEKGRFLFGVPHARKRPVVVDGLRVVFVAEGTLDGVKAMDEGFPVVTTQTNRMSAAQAHAMLGEWDVAIVLPDGDEAGVSLPKDTHKYAGSFLDTAVYHLPSAYKDLDSVPQSEIPALLTNAIETWSSKWKHLNRFQRQQLLVLNEPT